MPFAFADTGCEDGALRPGLLRRLCLLSGRDHAFEFLGIGLDVFLGARAQTVESELAGIVALDAVLREVIEGLMPVADARHQQIEIIGEPRAQDLPAAGNLPHSD